MLRNQAIETAMRLLLSALAVAIGIFFAISTKSFVGTIQEDRHTIAVENGANNRRPSHPRPKRLEPAIESVPQPPEGNCIILDAANLTPLDAVTAVIEIGTAILNPSPLR